MKDRENTTESLPLVPQVLPLGKGEKENAEADFPPFPKEVAASRRIINILGFTLVELIVVITILTILGTIAFISLGGFQWSARDGSRVSDLTNLSKSLDLYQIKSGSFPSPDNAINVTYSGGILWTQWTIGETVMNTLSSGWAKLSRKPMDPLTTTKEYVYSRLQYGSAYQLKTDYEGDSVAYTRLIDQASAASGNPLISYIRGTYNGIVAKTVTGSTVYLIAIPSIFISANAGTLLSTASATGFYIHGQTNSGGVLFTPKLVFSSGALPATNSDYILFASGIANAYSGTVLASQSTIASYITALSSNNTGTLASLGGNFVSSSLGGTASTSGGGGVTYTCATNPSFANLWVLTIGTPVSASQAWTYNATPGNCTYVCTGGYSGTSCAIAPILAYVSAASTTVYTAGNQFTYNGVTVTVTSAGIGTGSTTYAGCDTPDIVLWSSGNSPQIWAACNVGANTTTNYSSTATDRTSLSSVDGQLFQFARNDPFTNYGATPTVAGASPVATNIFTGASATTWYYDGGTKYDWRSTQLSITTNANQNLWTTSPCAANYHVPMQSEFQTAYNAFSNATYGNAANLPTILKMPYAGYRYSSTATLNNQGWYGYYWSSSPYTTTGYYMYFNSTGVNPTSVNNRADGFSVRCLKN